MIQRRKGDGKKERVRPAFIHGISDDKKFTHEQVVAQLVEDLRNVTERLLLETRKVRRLLEDAARERKAAKP